MLDEPWTEVRDIVQEEGIKTIPKKNKYKKAKWLSKEALQIAMKRRKVKGKGEKERYIHLNAEFLSDQCKKIEENNKIEKTRDCFWRRQWHPTPVLLPGKSHGRRSLVVYSPSSRKELDTTERLHFLLSLNSNIKSILPRFFLKSCLPSTYPFVEFL